MAAGEAGAFFNFRNNAEQNASQIVGAYERIQRALREPLSLNSSQIAADSQQIQGALNKALQATEADVTKIEALLRSLSNRQIDLPQFKQGFAQQVRETAEQARGILANELGKLGSGVVGRQNIAGLNQALNQSVLNYLNEAGRSLRPLGGQQLSGYQFRNDRSEVNAALAGGLGSPISGPGSGAAQLRLMAEQIAKAQYNNGLYKGEDPLAAAHRLGLADEVQRVLGRQAGPVDGKRAPFTSLGAADELRDAKAREAAEVRAENARIKAQAKEQAAADRELEQATRQAAKDRVADARSQRLLQLQGTEGVFKGRSGSATSEGKYFDNSGRQLLAQRAADELKINAIEAERLGLLKAEGDRLAKNNALEAERVAVGQRGFLEGAVARANRGGQGALANLGAQAVSAVQFTAGYGLLFAVQGALRDTVHEFLDYQDSVTDLRVAMGDGSAVTQAYVSDLSELSRVAGSNVGAALDTAARGVRALSDVQDSDAQKQKVGEQTARVAAQLALISNKTLQDATGDTLAVATAFNLKPEELDSVVDAVANAKRNVGGDAGQISQGLALISLSAQEAGFNLNEAAAVIGLVQARTDESGQAIATRLTRIFQIVQGSTGKGLAQELKAQLDPLGVSGQSSVKAQLEAYAKIYADPHTSETTKDRVASQLGGTANLRELLPLLKENDSLQRAYAESLSNAGQGLDEYQRKSENLVGTLKKVGGTLSNIQVGLANSGVGDFFGVAVDVLEPALYTLDKFLNLWNEMPRPLRTALGLLIDIAVAAKAIAVLQGAKLAVSGGAAAAENVAAAEVAAAAGVGGVAAGGAGAGAGAAVAALEAEAAAATQTAAAMAGEAAAATTTARVAQGELAIAQAGVAALEGMIAESTIAFEASIARIYGALGSREALQQEMLAKRAGAEAQLAAAQTEATAASQRHAAALAEQVAALVAATDAALAEAEAQAALAVAEGGATVAAEGQAVASGTGAASKVGFLGGLSRISGFIANPAVWGLAAGVAAAAIIGKSIEEGDRNRQIKETYTDSSVAYTKYDGTSGSLNQASGDLSAVAERINKVHHNILESSEAIEQNQAMESDLRARARSLASIAQEVAASEKLAAAHGNLTLAAGGAIETVTQLADGIKLIGDQGGTAVTQYNALVKALLTKPDPGKALFTSEQLGAGVYNSLASALRDPDLIPEGTAVSNPHRRPRTSRRDIETPPQLYSSDPTDIFGAVPIGSPGGILGLFPGVDVGKRVMDAVTQSLVDLNIDPSAGINPQQVDQVVRLAADKIDFKGVVKGADKYKKAVIEAAIKDLQGQSFLDPNSPAGLLNGSTLSPGQIQQILNPSEDGSYPGLLQSFQGALQAVPESDNGDQKATILKTQRRTLEKLFNKGMAYARSHPDEAADTLALLANIRLQLDNATHDAAADAISKLEDVRKAAEGKTSTNAQLQRVRLQFARREFRHAGSDKNLLEQVMEGLDKQTVDTMLEYLREQRDIMRTTLKHLLSLRQATGKAADALDAQGFDLTGNDKAIDNLKKKLDKRNAQIKAFLDVLSSADISEDVAGGGSTDPGEIRAAQAQANAARLGGGIAEAKAAIVAAQVALTKAAPGTAEYFQALASLYTAQQQMKDAVNAYKDTLDQLHGDITDPVEQARDALRSAIRKLASDRGKGRDVTAADRLVAEQARNSLEAAKFQQRLSDVQTAEQLGNISHAAYIRYLDHESQRLHSIKNKTRQQIDEMNQIDLALQDAAKALEGQFNLGDINTAGLVYQVRRSIAEARGSNVPGGLTGGGGRGGKNYDSAHPPIYYQNSGNTVTINGADTATVRRLLRQLLGPQTSTRTTSSRRR